MYEDVDLIVADYKENISKKEQAVISELISLINQTNDLYDQIIEEDDKQRIYFFWNCLPVLLTHLRYLVKHYAFKEEQECRIIKVEKLFNNSDVIVDESKSRMYIDYLPLCQRKENQNYITEIFFGPKAEGFKIFRDRINHSGLSILSHKSEHPFS